MVVSLNSRLESNSPDTAVALPNPYQDGVANATMDFLTSYVNMLKRATRVAPEQVIDPDPQKDPRTRSPPPARLSKPEPALYAT